MKKKTTMRGKKKKKVPDAMIAARRANRDIERETLGDGFHCRTRIQKSKKAYSRKGFKIDAFLFFDRIAWASERQASGRVNFVLSNIYKKKEF